jgi:DNA-binding helix-hairpin-helix protein with protein kinase domain
MNAPPPTVQTSLGRTLHLTQQIGKGGEGAIYETREQNDIAVKLYWPNKAQGRRDKIAAMASAQLYKTNSFVAFPIDILFAPNGAFAGFAMKKISASMPVHMLYSPASRRVAFSHANYKFLVLAAGNIARAVASVHACGCVIGDINHSGFLISDKATSVLIDSDSFQVVAANKSYLCQVGTPEYTPPELQGARFDRVTRTPNHDNFGLAVLIFQLLFMGRHPFSGRYQGSGDMPLERAINEHRFAYSANASATNMRPPPGAPLVTDFPPDIGQAFENAFGRAGRSKRPSAAEWISLLVNLEKNLVGCASDSAHQHVNGKPCPWCRMEQSSPGFIAFTPNVTATTIIDVDVGKLAAILKAIRDPGPTPEIQTAIVVPTAAPAAPSVALISTLKTRAYIGIGASAAGAILIFFGGIATLPGLAALGAGLVANVAVPKELRQLREARSQADRSWRGIQDAWTKQPGNANFLDKKTRTDALITELNDLPNEEKRQTRVLENNKRAAQLHRYLDRHLIANARIRKIGSGRKAVLASFGIETAADVVQSKILAIQGFGPGLVAELMAWKQGLANRFVYNASEPISPSDLLALESRLAGRKAELVRAIRASVASLQQESASSLNQRTKLVALANQAFAARKQAESNEQAATGSLHKASKFISICCAGLAAIGLLRDSGSMTSRAPEDKRVVTASVPEKPIADSKTSRTAGTSVPPATAPEPQVGSAGRVGQDNSEPAPPSRSAPPPPINAPPTPPARQSSITTGNEAPSNDTAENRSEVKSALQIQQRLVELGYLSSSAADGKWGPQSRRALSEYKRQAGLKLDDARDAATEQALFSDNAPRAVRTLLFVGGWSLEPGKCGDPGQPPPVRFTATRAESDGGFCIFNSIRPDGSSAWRIEASCSAGGSTHPAHVRLAVNGSVLRWTSEQPEVRYYRCPASQ